MHHDDWFTDETALSKFVMFLDDNPDADRTAKSAGMKVCGVYDATSESYAAQMKAENDFYIYRFGELLELKIE